MCRIRSAFGQPVVKLSWKFAKCGDIVLAFDWCVEMTARRRKEKMAKRSVEFITGHGFVSEKCDILQQKKCLEGDEERSEGN